MTKTLWRRPGAAVEEQARPAVLHQQLTAAPAWGERTTVAGGHADRYEPGTTAGEQSRDQPALGTESQPV